MRGSTKSQNKRQFTMLPIEESNRDPMDLHGGTTAQTSYAQPKANK